MFLHFSSRLNRELMPSSASIGAGSVFQPGKMAHAHSIDIGAHLSSCVCVRVHSISQRGDRATPEIWVVRAREPVHHQSVHPDKGIQRNARRAHIARNRQYGQRRARCTPMSSNYCRSVCPIGHVLLLLSLRSTPLPPLPSTTFSSRDPGHLTNDA